VTFTAAVTALAPGSGTPTGTVTFTVDGGAPSTIALSAANTVLAVNNLAVGNHTITATYSGDSSDLPSTANPFTETVNAPAPASTVVFLTPPSVMTAGQPAGPITAQLLDQNGQQTTAGSGGLTLQLASSAGGTFLDGSGNTLASPTITIPAGSSTASFEYMDVHAGTPALVVSAPGLPAAWQQETIFAAAPGAVLFATAPQSLTTGQLSATITVLLEDRYGNVAQAGSPGVTVSLQSTSSKGAFLDVAGRPLASPGITIGQASSAGSFEYLDTATGTPTLTVSGPGFAATQAERVGAVAVTARLVTPSQTFTAGQSIAITVQLQDAYGNAAPAGAGGVRLSLNSSSAGATFLDQLGHPLTAPASITIAEGASQAVFLYQDTSAGTPTLTVTAGNRWAPSTSLPNVAGLDHVATATAPDGTIYALAAGNGRTAYFFAWKPATAKWTGRAGLPIARFSPALAVGTDGTVYVTGGDVTPTHSHLPGLATQVDAYNPITNVWTTISNPRIRTSYLPSTRTGMAATTGIDGTIYCIGGTTPSGALSNEVDAFNPTTRTWSVLPSLPTARTGLSAVTGKDGTIYAICGEAATTSSPYTTCEVDAFNPTTRVWSVVASLPTARENLAAAVGADGTIYAIGGQTVTNAALNAKPIFRGEQIVVAADFSSEVDAYNPATATWTIMPALPTARMNLAAAARPDGTIYAIGGRYFTNDVHNPIALTTEVDMLVPGSGLTVRLTQQETVGAVHAEMKRK
jgi:N-acetylneuraminic acid mutarotase